jgi:predicted nuclease of predicted toxin-antitoxin system
MKILVDENIPRITVGGLRALGHDVKDLRGTSKQGVPDPDVWQIASTEARLLVTTDKGFTGYRAQQHHGILVIRLRQPNRHKINNAVMQAMQRFQEADWPNLLVVVRDHTLSTSRFTAP